MPKKATKKYKPGPTRRIELTLADVLSNVAELSGAGDPADFIPENATIRMHCGPGEQPVFVIEWSPS